MKPLHRFGGAEEGFLLLSALLLEPGGQAHAYLTTLGTAVSCYRHGSLNFLTIHLQSIKEEGTILSAVEDGKIGWICADVAFDALTRAGSYNTDKIIAGHKLLSYDQVWVAKTFSEILGRKITHTRVTVDDLEAMYVAAGYQKEFSKFIDDTRISGSALSFFFPIRRSLRYVFNQRLNSYSCELAQLCSSTASPSASCIHPPIAADHVHKDSGPLLGPEGFAFTQPHALAVPSSH